MLKVLTLCKPRRTDRNAGSLLMAWESLGVWRTEDDEIKFLLIIFYCSNLVLKVICLNLLWWLFNINQALFMTVTIKLFVLLVCSAMRFLVKWARRCFLENFVFSLFSVSCAFCVFFYTNKYKENVKIISKQKFNLWLVRRVGNNFQFSGKHLAFRFSDWSCIFSIGFYITYYIGAPARRRRTNWAP